MNWHWINCCFGAYCLIALLMIHVWWDKWWAWRDRRKRKVAECRPDYDGPGGWDCPGCKGPDGTCIHDDA